MRWSAPSHRAARPSYPVVNNLVEYCFLQHCYIYYICIHATLPHTVIRLPKYRQIIAATFLLVNLFIGTPVQWLHSHEKYPQNKTTPVFFTTLKCSLCEKAKQVPLPLKHHHIGRETETCAICAHQYTPYAGGFSIARLSTLGPPSNIFPLASTCRVYGITIQGLSNKSPPPSPAPVKFRPSLT